jgi:predicted small secreted protein
MPDSVSVPLPVFTSDPPTPSIPPLTAVETLLPPVVSWLAPRAKLPAPSMEPTVTGPAANAMLRLPPASLMKRACPPEASLKNRVIAPPVVRTVALPAVLWLKNSNKLLLVILAFPAVLALKKLRAPLLVMVAFSPVLEAKKLSAPLLVIAALPAEVESMNERMPLLLVIVALPAELKVVKRTFPRLLLMVALPAVAPSLKVRALKVLLMTALSAEEKSRNSRLPPRTLMVALLALLASRNNTEEKAGALVMVEFPAVASSLNTMREVGQDVDDCGVARRAAVLEAHNVIVKDRRATTVHYAGTCEPNCSYGRQRKCIGRRSRIE